MPSASVGLVAVAHAASAQGELAGIVHASDGTLYLLKNGAHYAIVSDAIDDDELAMYADGGAIDSSELVVGADCAELEHAIIRRTRSG